MKCILCDQTGKVKYKVIGSVAFCCDCWQYYAFNKIRETIKIKRNPNKEYFTQLQERVFVVCGELGLDAEKIIERMGI